jgi:hypothetical protein
MMKSITNNSLQAFDIFLMTEKGLETVWMSPKKTIVVPESYITEQVINCAKRRIFKIKNA